MCNFSMVAGSLKEFALMLNEIADQWSATVERCEIQLVSPLET